MELKKLSRREMLKAMGLAMTGAALAACAPKTQTPVPGGAEEDSPQDAPAEPEEVTIRFAGWGNVEELALYDNIAALFMEENPNVTVETIGLPGGEYGEKLFTWIASGNPPDNLRVGTQYFPTLYEDDVVADLTSYFTAMPELLDDTKYLTQLYDIYTMSGKKYATVLGPNVMALYYNVDLFEEAGVEAPTMEWTYDDYVDAAIKLTAGDGVNKTWGATNGYWWMIWESMLWARGGDLFDAERDPTKCTLDSPEMVETCAWLQDLVHTHKAAPTTAEASGLEGGWNSGRVGMEINGTWAVNARRSIDAFRWDLAHLPMADKHAAAHAAGGIVLPKSTEHPDEAWALAAYHQSDAAQELYARDGLNTPIMLKWAESDVFLNLEGAPAGHKTRIDAMEYSRNRDFYFGEWTEVLNKVFAPEMDKLMANDQTPEETARNMAEGANELLAD